jgi:hypothetical protein
MFLLVGCPVSSKFPLGSKGEIAFEENLLGSWSTEDSASSAHKVTITEGTEINTATLHVDVRGGTFMADGDDFEVWLTILKNQTFLVLEQTLDGAGSGSFYVFHLDLNGNTLVASDISLKVNGTDAITSIESYREEVKASMTDPEFLTTPILWTKN